MRLFKLTVSITITATTITITLKLFPSAVQVKFHYLKCKIYILFAIDWVLVEMRLNLETILSFLHGMCTCIL